MEKLVVGQIVPNIRGNEMMFISSLGRCCSIEGKEKNNPLTTGVPFEGLVPEPALVEGWMEGYECTGHQG